MIHGPSNVNVVFVCSPRAQDFISYVSNGLTAHSDLPFWTTAFPSTLITTILFSHPYHNPLSDSLRSRPASFAYK